MLKVNLSFVTFLLLTSLASTAQSKAPCGQSPINLTNAYEIDIRDIEYHYPLNINFNVTTDGHTVKCTPAGGEQTAWMMLDGEKYTFLQFHTHTPSEHIIEGAGAPLEIHLVHQSANGAKLSVIGVLVNTSNTPPSTALNPLLALLTNNAPPSHESTPSEEHTSPHLIGACSLNLYSILPTNKRTYRYSGSLTTPPYTEGVEWNVMSSPITVTPDLVNKVIAFTTEKTARPLQQTTVPVVLDEQSEQKPNMPPRVQSSNRSGKRD